MIAACLYVDAISLVVTGVIAANVTDDALGWSCNLKQETINCANTIDYSLALAYLLKFAAAI
jgi:hypothetical protein